MTGATGTPDLSWNPVTVTGATGTPDLSRKGEGIRRIELSWNDEGVRIDLSRNDEAVRIPPSGIDPR
ncbi:hypothetical protein OG462_24715 [Streptomyces sp. NBC_01077]|uniref:hypothetical protein n=1 Tax=Streptomyces sp. NBC_01077 TaxID=2903746 RepID=UPI00387023AE|nr:hypothetical protein OG462_24715 [Streptomyces sp. NBC_01077]